MKPDAALRTYAFRLKPGEDLKKALETKTRELNLPSGWIVTCAGSLTDYCLRYANQPDSATGSGHFEIVSLTGTLSPDGPHLHISLCDSTGRCFGGHLMEGCTIYTTAEIVIQSSDSIHFSRKVDGTTPWDELQIQQ